MAAADHLAASLAEWKPLLKLNIVNGYPVLRFDGSNDRLGGSFTNGGTMAQPLIMVMVAKLGTGLADNNTNYFLASTSGTADAQYYFQVSKQGATTPDKWDLNAGATIRSTAAADDVWNIWTMLLNGASSRLWHNGVLEASGNAGAATPNGLLIGGNFNGTSNWNGDVAEALLYAANLSDADKNQIGAYAAARYGLSYTNIA
jgi:hypothetical protein